MDFEFFIIIALIIVFLVSCCGLIQKIRENYSEEGAQAISIAQVSTPSQTFNNNAYQMGDELSTGIFPASLAPPPYLDHYDPPPSYEDLVKEQQFTVIQMSHNHGEEPQALFINENRTNTEISQNSRIT